MIKKEIINGEEFFAVDESTGVRCSECVFGLLHCGNIPCTPSQRVDQRAVYFRPVHELRTLAAYHAQKHSDMQ